MAAFRLPVALLDELRAGADRLGLSQARLIAEAVRAYLAQREG